MNINDIATKATQIKKPNKAVAFSLVKSLAQGDLDVGTLASLYAFFIPAITKPKTPEQWVAKAVGKNDVRYYLNYCYSDGKRYMATDGHRLHFIPTDRPEGFYDTDGARLECADEWKFPDVDRIIPEDKSMPFDQDVEIIDDGTHKYDSQAAVVAEGVYVNYKYLKEALSLPSDVKISSRTSIDSIRLDFDNDRHAVIMPMRV